MLMEDARSGFYTGILLLGNILQKSRQTYVVQLAIVNTNTDIVGPFTPYTIGHIPLGVL